MSSSLGLMTFMNNTLNNASYSVLSLLQKKQFLFLCRISETQAVEQCIAITDITETSNSPDS